MTTEKAPRKFFVEYGWTEEKQWATETLELPRGISDVLPWIVEQYGQLVTEDRPLELRIFPQFGEFEFPYRLEDGLPVTDRTLGITMAPAHLGGGMVVLSFDFCVYVADVKERRQATPVVVKYPEVGVSV